METEDVLSLKQTSQRIEAEDADLSGSTFLNVRMREARFDDADLRKTRISNANLSGTTIRDANLTGVQIEESLLDGMTINGIPVPDLLASYLNKTS